MSTFVVVTLFLLGLILIIKGGDYFVDAASWIAEVSGIPKFIVGATVVSIATTLPELLVSIFAAAEGKVDMAIGNAVGSVTANTGLIMAISILAIPTVIKRKSFAPKGFLLIACLTVLFSFTYTQRELRIPGCIILLVIFIIFIFENIKAAQSNVSDKRLEVNGKKEIIVNIIKFIGGSAGIVIGAQLLVDNGSKIATIFNIPESIVSVTMIAIGTSLPELVTTITAIVKKQSSLSIGNIVGANIIDTTLIMPICAFINGSSLPISYQSLTLDIPVCLGITLLAIIPALVNKKFSRWQGALMLIAYIGYLALLVI